MARISGVDIPREKRLEISLTYIYGVGRTQAQRVCAETDTNPDTRVRDLTDEEVAEITGLRSGTVRVRLHRARLFVRKELMKVKARRPHAGRMIEAVTSRTATKQPRPARCKAMFAELSNYLDEQLDDSLCDELEKHLDGCDACKAFLASLEATIEDCRHLRSPAPNCVKAAKLRKEVISHYERAMANR